MRLFALLFILSSITSIAQTYQATWESIDSRPTPTWFTDAKFGIFIHWGVYSVPSWGPLPRDGASVYECYAEWYWWRLMNTNDKAHHFFKQHHDKTYGADFKYQDFVNNFTCEMFDPDQWAKVLKGSGARYVVLTSKHHEGFTLWPSAHSPKWNAVDAGPHRDLAGDLIHAVRKEGLKMGYYYSLYEWFNPLYHSDVNAYVDQHMMPQMKDLVTRYKPDIFWTDGEWDHPSETWKSTQFLSWLYNESPVKEHVVVNDRWGKETRSVHGGIYTTEYDLVHDASSAGKKIDHPWEECRGIGSSFGYNRNENLADYNSSFELIRILIDKVARGGNLLLNIGPTADGRIPVIMQQRLSDIGGWLSVNGEAIYETSPWEKSVFTENQKIFYTKKGKDLYVLCTTFPENGIDVPFVTSAQSVTLLGVPGNLKFSKSGNGMRISPAANTSSFNKLNYPWVFKIAGALK